MKKKDYILIGVVALFLVGSFFLTGKKDNEKDMARWTETYTKTELAKGKLNTMDYYYFEALTNVSKENTIVYLGSATCSWCNKFKPILEEIISENNLEVVYIDLSTVSNEEYKKITNTVGKNNFSGTPTTLIMNGNKVIDALQGYNEKEETVEFFKTNGFIK